jgi:DNA polymerase I-like protein with 3'-5' exonuclease and polymerase domains
LKYLPTLDQFHNYWYVDLETELIPKAGVKHIKKIWMMCVSRLDSNDVRSLVGHEAISEWIKQNVTEETKLVGHNALSFDVIVLNSVLDCVIPLSQVVDTLVLSYLYDPGMPGGHSLEAWGERLKDLKGKFNDFSSYSLEMDKYCQQDVRLGKKVFKALVARLRKIGVTELACEIEHDIRVVIDEQQDNGWYFDIPKAQTLLSELRARQVELEGPIRELFPPHLVPCGTYKRRKKKDGTEFSSYEKHLQEFSEIHENDDGTYTVYDYQEFNIGSPKQRLERLLELGWKPVTFNAVTDAAKARGEKQGSPKVDEESILAYAEESNQPTVKTIAEWLVLQGRATMVEGWLNNVNYDDHCMHGKVLTCAATTRRMIHSSPNTANIPKAKAKVPYGIRCRKLWTVRPGRVQVGGDANGLEMRMFAEYLATDEAIKLFTEGDPHINNTRNLGLPDHMRDLTVKNGFYAYLYGAGDPKLGKTLKPELQGREAGEYGKWARSVLEQGTPGLAKLIADIEDEFNHNGGVLKTIDGGFVRCNAKSAALNYKLQSAGAIVMKKAAIIARQKFIEFGLDALLIGTIHDENQYDVLPEHAQQVGEVYVQSIRDAGIALGFKCPLDGAFKIGANWAECH